MSDTLESSDTLDARGALDQDGAQSILTVTAAARSTILEARAGEIDADRLALWLEVRKVGPKFAYDMFFQSSGDAKQGDWTMSGDLPVVVPAPSIDLLRGATLDVAADGSGGMVILNPNEPAQPAPGAAPAGDLSSPLAARIQTILEQSINPQIASHGGWARLVSVDGDVAYLQLGGGCQGCAGSQATLKKGIEVAIKDAVPEISQVIDVTDHAHGSNPYYS